MIGDIAYLGPEREETLDLYLPADDQSRNRPALLVIHGGGFCGADKADAREKSICGDLAEAGYVCASINYALGTRENRWLAYPQNLLDAKCAVAYLRQHAENYGVDPDRIGAIGGSAGGTLSLWLALTAANDDLRPPQIDAATSVAVQVAVNLYGPTDFSQPLPFTTPANVIAAASPIHQVTSAAPPILTVQGMADELVAPLHAELLQLKLNEAGVDNAVKYVEGGVHGMDLQPPQEDLRVVVLPFIGKALA